LMKFSAISMMSFPVILMPITLIVATATMAL
jgi:hypothetical protein